MDFGTQTVPLPALAPYHARVYYPTVCRTQCGQFQSGGMPVMLFVTGFAGQLAASDYDVILSEVAAHGIVVVAVDQYVSLFQLTVNYALLATELLDVVDFIQDPSASGLLQQIKAGGFRTTFYNGAAKLIMGGHTTGALIVIQQLYDNAENLGTCGSVAGGIVMLSPLDGGGQLGLGQNIVSNGDKLPFDVPALIIAGSLDGVSSTLTTGLSCVPASNGDIHFYNAWNGLIYYIEALGMGVLDVLDEGSVSIYTQECAGSNSSEVTERASYRNMVKGSIVSFITGVVLATQQDLDYLTYQYDLVYPCNTFYSGSGLSFSCSFVEVAPQIDPEITYGLYAFGVLFAITFVWGLYYFFRRMDDDTLHRYHPMEGVGYEEPASFRTKLEPNFNYTQPSLSASVANERYIPASNNSSRNYDNSSRAPSINV